MSPWLKDAVQDTSTLPFPKEEPDTFDASTFVGTLGLMSEGVTEEEATEATLVPTPFIATTVKV